MNTTISSQTELDLSLNTTSFQKNNLTFECDSCIKIPLVFKSEDWFQQIVKHLTRTSPSYSDPSIFETVKLFDVQNGNLLVPRFYPIEKFGHNKVNHFPDEEKIEFQFKSQLRNDLQKLSYEMMITCDNGIVQLPPGEGKTVIAISAISKIGLKSIIFVHKDALSSQWKERFLQHTNLMDENISLLENNKFEEMLKKPIVISTVQSMLSAIKRFPNIKQLLWDAKFGVAIFDECHATGGATAEYGKVALHIPCRRIYGLSATPSRSDLNHDVIGMNIGPVFKPAGKSNTLNPKIIMVYFDHKCVSYHKRYIYWGIPDNAGNFKLKYPRFDMPRYLQMLTSKKNDQFIPYLKKIVEQVYRSGRISLLLSDRIKILDLSSRIIPNKNDVGFFIPRSGKERDSDLQKKFVFSTYGSFKEGVDKPSLNCLIMATPTGNVEQAIGRICRFLSDKQEPIVFDLIDSGCNELIRRSEYRKKFYESKGWKVEEKFLK